MLAFNQQGAVLLSKTRTESPLGVVQVNDSISSEHSCNEQKSILGWSARCSWLRAHTEKKIKLNKKVGRKSEVPSARQKKKKKKKSSQRQRAAFTVRNHLAATKPAAHPLFSFTQIKRCNNKQQQLQQKKKKSSNHTKVQR